MTSPHFYSEYLNKNKEMPRVAAIMHQVGAPNAVQTKACMERRTLKTRSMHASGRIPDYAPESGLYRLDKSERNCHAVPEASAPRGVATH